MPNQKKKKNEVNIWLFSAGRLRLTSERTESWREKIHL